MERVKIKGRRRAKWQEEAGINSSCGGVSLQILPPPPPPPAVHFSPSVMVQLSPAALPAAHVLLPRSGEPPQDTDYRPEPGPVHLGGQISTWLDEGDIFAVNWNLDQLRCLIQQEPVLHLPHERCCNYLCYYSKEETAARNLTWRLRRFRPTRKAGWTSLTFGSSPRPWCWSISIKVIPSSLSVAPGRVGVPCARSAVCSGPVKIIAFDLFRNNCSCRCLETCWFKFSQKHVVVDCRVIIISRGWSL